MIKNKNKNQKQFRPTTRFTEQHRRALAAYKFGESMEFV